jgi:glycosyltransferase involved in cell wall biosynthesis
VLYGLFNDSFPPLTDGVAQTVLNYARCLHRDDNQSCVVVPRYPGARDDYPFKVIRYPAVSIKRYTEYSMGIPHASLSIMNRLDKLPFALLHAHCPFTSGILALRVARKRRIPLVATFHSKYADDFTQRTGWERSGRLAASWSAQFYGMADEVWTVNRGTEKTLRQYGYDGEVRIMPNGCDFPALTHDSALTRILRQRYRLPEGPVLLFVGRLVAQKNPDLVLKSAARLKARGEAFSLLIVGGGEWEERMRTLAGELDLWDRVAFAGRILDRQDLQTIYRGADLLVFPSMYDNAPLVVREAAACGCPSLLIAQSNASEGVEDGVNGFTTQMDDDALAATIGELLHAPGRLTQAGENARKTLYVPWENVVRQAESEYRRILSQYVEKRLRSYDRPVLHRFRRRVRLR